MAFTHGKNAFFEIDDSGGTPRNLTTFVTDVSLPRDIDMAETSTFGNTYKTFIQGLANATISISGRWDSTATTGPDAVLAGLIGAANTSTFSYGPEGNGVGKVKYTGEVYLSSYEITSPVTDVVSFTAQFQLATDGSFSRTTFA
jgi:hypothetical protein